MVMGGCRRRCRQGSLSSPRDAQLADSAALADALLALRTLSTARYATPAALHNLATSASRGDRNTGVKLTSPPRLASH